VEQLRQTIRQLITLSDDELTGLLANCQPRTYPRQGILSQPGGVPNEIYFVCRGLIRVIVTDREGQEHTVHFALENGFVADYASFILKQHSLYTLQAVEETRVIVLPRSAIEYGYAHMTEGDRLGRLIAESYFVYHDDRIKNFYVRTPKERYDVLTDVFPNIHNRVPQHMIASYLGITPVHLSRLKKADALKV
jgi:CRP-like cAMP-binding protein